MVSFEQLQSKQEKVCVVGLGYVGLPLAILLAKHFDVVGFDIDAEKIHELKNGHDRTGEVVDADLASSSLVYSHDPATVKEAKFIIVAVPTPVDGNKVPDLGIVKRATTMVGEHLQPGSIVVYESTVYPGVTEDICVPLLEKASGLTVKKDFKVGYSPERVNPGDKEHTIDKIVKVTAGIDAASAEVIAQFYGTITNTFSAASIAVAEAAKVIENSQRDLNIAFMNELAIICNKVGMSAYDVIEAASTKWNFLKFTPGLVGGHCIGVDPFYLTYKAESLGYRPEVILAGRGINDGMPRFIAQEIVKTMVKAGKNLQDAVVNLYGITFKENIHDIRNSKVAALYHELAEFGITANVYDPWANPKEVEEEYGITLTTDSSKLPSPDAAIVAVAHKQFKEVTPQQHKAHMKDGGLLFDIKRIYNKEDIEAAGLQYWSL